MGLAYRTNAAAVWQYKPMRLILRYTACGGLINQHYAHIAALSLATALGAEVVLPPAFCRDSFGTYFSLKESNQVQWSATPLDMLLDVDNAIKHWAARGLMLHRTPELLQPPDVSRPHTAYPSYKASRSEAEYIARCEPWTRMLTHRSCGGSPPACPPALVLVQLGLTHSFAAVGWTTFTMST